MSINLKNTLFKYLDPILHERVGHYWLSWVQACESLEQELPIFQASMSDLPLLGKIWACSEFIARTMIRNPSCWYELNQNKAFEKKISLDDYRQQLTLLLNTSSSLTEAVLMKKLRLFRAQQMLRIAWRDLADLADTTETLCNLTDLAEACVDITLETLYQDQCKEWGIPLNSHAEEQRLSIIGMGKLGGYELNFSSDIDLIFCFEEEGEIAGKRSRTNSQFFTRLAQRFIKMLNDITADGFVFRVDMRLRPYGESGPLVMSHTGMEIYYQKQGRDWERYAMIKARIIGGDRVKGQMVMEMLRPFVYRRYLDFGAFESIREMKALIDTEVRRKGNLYNIKLGSGGIREIEFIGQTFQLLRGGSEPELQARSILKILQLLVDKNYLEQKESTALALSYDFLRRLENRLQIYDDAQTHLLPEAEDQQLSVALSMGYEQWQELFDACEQHRQMVQATFAQLLHDKSNNEDIKTEKSIAKSADKSVLKSIWKYQQDEEEAVSLLETLGMLDASKVYQMLQTFKLSSQLNTMTPTGRQRLDTLMPTLLNLLKAQNHPLEVLTRLLDLLQSILRRSVYLSLLNEYPGALKQLIKLCAASPWLAKLLSRYPVLLDELLDPRNLYQISSQLKLKQELDDLIEREKGDEEQQIEVLRRFKQAQVLKIAAMDVAEVLDVFEVSEQLTMIAEVLLEKVMEIARLWMESKYGNPWCIIDDENGGERYQPSIAVVAYGKMGGKELGYSSDLDLVFLHDSSGSQQQTDGERCLDNASYFARLAQRVIQLLSLRTANGRLYETDMRLRPDGNAGLLVSNVQAYGRYQHKKAWTWEHQALIRARILCSSAHLKAEFDRIRCSILMQPRDRGKLASDVVDMRKKMQEVIGDKAKRIVKSSECFHLKQGSGGLVDIEFIAQFGILLFAKKCQQLTEYTATRKILLQLVECELISTEQAQLLIEAYKDYRTCSHQRALQQLPPTVDRQVFATRQKQVVDIWRYVFKL